MSDNAAIAIVISAICLTIGMCSFHEDVNVARVKARTEMFKACAAQGKAYKETGFSSTPYCE